LIFHKVTDKNKLARFFMAHGVDTQACNAADRKTDASVDISQTVQITSLFFVVSDIAVFVLKRGVKLQLTHSPVISSLQNKQQRQATH